MSLTSNKPILPSELFSDTLLANPYIPHDPTIKQAEFLVRLEKEVLYGGAAGGGKALTLDTPILTSQGWKDMRDVIPGDVVYDETGAPCNVIAISDVMHNHQVYRIEFDDGSAIKCDADHLWWVFSDSDRAALHRRTDEFRENRRVARELRGTGKRPDLSLKNKSNPTVKKDAPKGVILKTRDMIDSVLKRGNRKNYSIKTCSPIERDAVDFPISPYVLGVWLGDGHSSGCGFTTDDKEILSYIEREGHSIKKWTGKYAYGISNLTSKLRTIGVLKNKHIPGVYLKASIHQRFELLKGLMDTDGTCLPSGSCEFYNTNRRLIDDVYELLISLGFKCCICIGRATLNGKDCGEKYRIKFTTSTPVFKLSRKLCKQVKSERGTQSWRYISSITPIESEPVKCIAVDSPNKLYLAGKTLIPTHNSDALLMAALMFVEVPGYAAIIFRESFSDLALPGAIMDRATEWLGPYLNDKTVHWDDKIKTFTFPNGSTLSFGYLTGPRDRFRYQSAEFQFIGFDELTQLKERDYRYLMSRLRRLINTYIPLRVRAASNPGGTGHDWVKERFVSGNKLFIPAKLDDNPHLDREEYIKTLMELDPVTRAQLMEGDWEIGIEGNLFKRYWFKLNDIADNYWNKKLRFWDLAATEKNNTNEPDWCTGLLLGRHDNKGCVLDIVHIRLRPAEVEATIAHTARLDGQNVRIAIEQEGGASAKLLIDTWKRGILKGYTVDPARPSGNKVVRAKVVSAPSERGEIYVKPAGWNSEFFDELTRFPEGAHDDMCLVGDTKVITIGNVETCISDIKPGDFVLTHSGYREVTNHIETHENATVYKLILDNGQQLIGTETHKIYANGRFTKISDLQIGDELVCIQNPSFLMGSLSEGIQNQRSNHMQDISGHMLGTSDQESDTCIKRFGNLFMAISQKIMQFTTLTGIISITIYQIWNAFQQKNMRDCIARSGVKKIVSMLKCISLKLGILHLIGINPMKEENGIDITQLKSQKMQHLKRMYVSNVGMNLNPQEGPLDSALRLVEIDIEENRGLKTSQKYVQFVEKNSHAIKRTIEGHALVSARLLSIQVESEKSAVYDITVDGSHTFFANGILVHNCDAFSGAYAELFGDLTCVKKENIPKRNKKNPRGGFT